MNFMLRKYRTRFFADRRDTSQQLALAHQLQMVIRHFVIPPLAVTGVICNLLIVIVLRRDKSLNRTTRFLLQMLTIADSVFYVFLPFHPQLGFIYEYPLSFSNLELFSVLVLSNGSQTAAAWMTVVVTYHRYVAVSRPLHARHYITMSRARFTVASVWIVSILISFLIIFFDFLRPGFRIFGTIRLLPIVASLSLLLTNWLPMSLTVFFNIQLILEMRRSRKFRSQQLPSRNNNDNRLDNNSRHVTVTMTVIIIVYLVCQLPSAIFETLNLINYVTSGSVAFGSRTYSIFGRLLRVCGFLLIVINSFADCVTYFLMGKRCREILINTLFCR
jgi:hypothetical protein